MLAAGTLRRVEHPYRDSCSLSNHPARVSGKNRRVAFFSLHHRRRAGNAARLRRNQMGLSVGIGAVPVSTGRSTNHRSPAARYGELWPMKVVLDIETIQCTREDWLRLGGKCPPVEDKSPPFDLFAAGEAEAVRQAANEQYAKADFDVTYS